MCNYCRSKCSAVMNDCTSKKLHKKLACKNISRLLEKVNALITSVDNETNGLNPGDVETVSDEVAILATLVFDAITNSPYFKALPSDDPTKYVFSFVICSCIFVPIFACNIQAHDGTDPQSLINLTDISTEYIPQDLSDSSIIRASPL